MEGCERGVRGVRVGGADLRDDAGAARDVDDLGSVGEGLQLRPLELREDLDARERFDHRVLRAKREGRGKSSTKRTEAGVEARPWVRG